MTYYGSVVDTKSMRAIDGGSWDAASGVTPMSYHGLVKVMSETVFQIEPVLKLTSIAFT